MKGKLLAFTLGLIGSTLVFASAEKPPTIQSLLKPSIYERVIGERDPEVHAKLEEDEHYSIYAAMQVRASPRLTRQILTDYSLYSKLVPYVDHANFDASKQILDLQGGIWKYRLRSFVKFEEKGPGWIRYEIVRGNFQGLKGDILFEPLGEAATLVYLRGAVDGFGWPPRLIIERGAEVVFGFTARKMRSYIEESKTKGIVHGTEHVGAQAS